MSSQTIDKLDAACRQLNTAISLWFNNGDAVSIHTLACSAHQIVHDINHRKGGRDLLYDSILFKDEYRLQAINHLKKGYNFLKHADDDPAGTVEFDPIINELFIMFTSLGLELLGRKPDEVRGAFNIYYGLRNPQFLTEKGKAKFIDAVPEESRKFALSLSKQQFFETYTLLPKQREQELIVRRNMEDQDAETRALKGRFDAAMFNIYRRANSEFGYNPTRLLQMLHDHGGLETARILLHASAVSDGYVALWERGGLELTVEAVILDPEWRELFSDEEREIARKRLSEYGYKFKGELA